MLAMITDAHLLYLNGLGLIPGPEEDESTFLRRSEECLRLSHTLSAQVPEALGVKPEELSSSHLLDAPLRKTQELYDIAPDWVPILFSNQGLAPWHGACAWICQLAERTPTIAFFQLRKPLATKTHYLGFYQRDEIMVHELSHIGRMAFEEPQFEELLAFRSAQSPIRRWLGPILISGGEALAFATLLFILLVLIMTHFLYPSLTTLTAVFSMQLVVLGMATLALLRLHIRHRHFNQCLQHLTTLLGDARRANAVIYRLRDKEIALFAQLPPKKILSDVHQWGKTSLRWRLLLLAYFSKQLPLLQNQ